MRRRLGPKGDAELTRMWNAGKSCREISRALGIPESTVSGVRQRLGLPGRGYSSRQPTDFGFKEWHWPRVKLTPWPSGMRFIDVWIDELEAEMPRLCTTVAIMRAKRYVTYGFSGSKSSMGDAQI